MGGVQDLRRDQRGRDRVQKVYGQLEAEQGQRLSFALNQTDVDYLFNRLD